MRNRRFLPLRRPACQAFRIKSFAPAGEAKFCRAFDSFAPAHSACGLPVCVAGVPAAPLCETPGQFGLAFAAANALQETAPLALNDCAETAHATAWNKKFLQGLALRGRNRISTRFLPGKKKACNICAPNYLC